MWQVERLTLEVEWAGHPSMAPRDQMASQQAVWKPNPVAMWLPPETPATKVRVYAVLRTMFLGEGSAALQARRVCSTAHCR